MSSTASPVYGGPVGTAFSKTCPPGRFISDLAGKQDAGVVSVAATCTDGTNLGTSGGSTGSWRDPGPCDGGIDGAQIVSSSATIGKVGQFCNGNPGPTVGRGDIIGAQSTAFNCPDGQKVKGISGRAGDTVNSIQFFCDSPGWGATTDATPPLAFVSGSPLATMAAPTDATSPLAFVSGSPLSTMAAPTSSMSGPPLSTMAAPTSSMSGSPLSTSSGPTASTGGGPRSGPSSVLVGAPSSAPTSGPTSCIEDGEVSAKTDGEDCCSGNGIDEDGKCKAKGTSTGVIIGIVVLMLLILAMIGYAMSRGGSKPSIPVVPNPPALK